MHESQELAKFVSGLKYEHLPPEVIARAKELILDQVGIMMGVATLPWSKVIYEYVKDLGGSKLESTVAHYGLKTNAENAVFANSSFGHGFEMDDLYIPGSSHPGCITVPAALAMAEKESLGGKDVILAVVAGYEVMGRINAAITPSCALRGFHSATSVTGPFGAACVAGKALDFSPDLMLHALSIAGSHAAGVTEYDQGGGSVKRMHAGMAAQGGLRSALIARKGLTGPPAILEGKHGFCKAFADEYDLKQLTAGLGQDFRVTLGSCIKAYCACAGMHAGIDALRKLKDKHKLKAGEIKEITMGTNRRSISHVSAEPTDITSAQFSAQFGLALLMIRGGNGFDDYTETTLRDPAILELADKVKLEVDKEVDSEYPKTRGARVTVKLSNGTAVQEKVDYPKGTPQNPMTREEREQKFYGLTSLVTKKERADEIVRVVNSLDQQKTISSLISLMS